MPTVIDSSDVLRMLEEGAQLLDVLDAEEHAEERIPGALNVPLTELGPETTSHLAPDRPVIVYCHDRD